VHLTGRYRIVNEALLYKKASLDDPRRPFYIAMLANHRSVRLDHNAPEYHKASDALVQTIEAVRSNNEYRATDPEDRDQRIAELEAGARLLKAERVRPHAVKVVPLDCLKYLAKRFADEWVGEVAKAAVKAFLTLIATHLL
jgi:hypothetical protein